MSSLTVIDDVIEEEEKPKDKKEYYGLEVPFNKKFLQDTSPEVWEMFYAKYPLLLDEKEIQAALDKLKMILTVNFRFYSILLSVLDTKIVKTDTILLTYEEGTDKLVDVDLTMRAATDFTNIIWDAAFFSNLTTPERIFIYLHEVLHCALLHMLRVSTSPMYIAYRKARSMLEKIINDKSTDKSSPVARLLMRRVKRLFRRINISLDHPINISLKDDAQRKPNLIKLIEDICLDEKFRGMTSEEIFAELSKRAPPGDDEYDNDGMGESFDNHNFIFDDADKPGHKQTFAKWEKAIRKAVMAAKMSGERLTGGQEMIIKEFDKRNSKVNYIQVLQQAVINEHRRETTRRPNRRYLPHGIYIDSMKSNTIEIVLMVDTSGSRMEELGEVLREVLSIVAAYNSYKIHFYAVDTEIAHYEVFDITNPITAEKVQKASVDGGGTNFISFFEELDRIQNRKLVLVITDMEATFPETSNQNVIWLVPQRFERHAGDANFGKALII